jgi:hypothetical protein
MSRVELRALRMLLQFSSPTRNTHKGKYIIACSFQTCLDLLSRPLDPCRSCSSLISDLLDHLVEFCSLSSHRCLRVFLVLSWSAVGPLLVPLMRLSRYCKIHLSRRRCLVHLVVRNRLMVASCQSSLVSAMLRHRVVAFSCRISWLLVSWGCQVCRERFWNAALNPLLCDFVRTRLFKNSSVIIRTAFEDVESGRIVDGSPRAYRHLMTIALCQCLGNHTSSPSS